MARRPPAMNTARWQPQFRGPRSRRTAVSELLLAAAGGDLGDAICGEASRAPEGNRRLHAEHVIESAQRQGG
eukprot:14825167-Heterocapsa_arctica.AAC.1